MPTTEEPAFGGDGIWPPRHRWVERCAHYTLIRCIMALPREYQDEPVTEATVNVFFPASDPCAPRVTVRGRRERALENIELTINVE